MVLFHVKVRIKLFMSGWQHNHAHFKSVVSNPFPMWLWPLIRGAFGPDGREGEKGEKGWPGMVGDRGSDGQQGTEKGRKGECGSQGTQGPRVSVNKLYMNFTA